MGQYGMPMLKIHLIGQKVNFKTSWRWNKKYFYGFSCWSYKRKRIMLMMFKNQVSAICGTHTHVGTDDLQIFENTAYLTDIGLTGCRDNVIGMDE